MASFRIMRGMIKAGQGNQNSHWNNGILYMNQSSIKSQFSLRQCEGGMTGDNSMG